VAGTIFVITEIHVDDVRDAIAIPFLVMLGFAAAVVLACLVAALGLVAIAALVQLPRVGGRLIESSAAAVASLLDRPRFDAAAQSVGLVLFIAGSHSRFWGREIAAWNCSARP
jgi:hypothetical protein